MRKLLCAAAALAMMTPQLAMAQAHNDNHGRQAARQHKQQAARPERQQAARPQRQQAVRQQAARQQRGVAVHSQAVRQQAARQQHATAVHTQAVRQQAARQQRAIRTRTERVQQANRTARVQNRRQRPAGYRPAHVQRVRARAFHYPRGYHYRRWNSGSILPRVFLSRYYYYPSWYDLGFGPPPPGYQWVRYGPDLLLVNVYTGRIRDVAYNVFY
jgi:Ni/Co efflux regulator RcnB